MRPSRSLRSVIALCLSLALAAPACIARGKGPWDEHIDAGRAALVCGDYDSADRYIKQAMEDTRKFKDDDIRLGSTYYEMGELNVRLQNFSLAKEYYERALAVQQKLLGAETLEAANSLYGIALCCQQLGDHLAAEIFLKRVDEIWRKKLSPRDPKLISILPSMAAYASMKNNFASAETYYKDLVDIAQASGNQPQLGNYLNLLSATLGNEGKYDEAKNYATRAVDILEKSSESSIAMDAAQDNLIVIRQKIGDKTSTPIISSAQNSKQERQQERERQAKEQARLSAEKQAKQLHEERQPEKTPVAQKEKPENTSSPAQEPGSKPWQTDHAIKKAQSGESQQWGKVSYLADGRLISAEEYKALLLSNEAYDAMRQEKYRMAVDILNKALELCPELPSAHTNIGLALSRIGKTEEAIDHLQIAISLDPSRSAPWVNLASSFQTSGRLKDCIVTYKEYLRRFPADSLASKARDLVKHLQEETDEEDAVERSMAIANESGTKDYFPFATASATVKWTGDRMPVKVYLASGSRVPGYKPEYKGIMSDSFKSWSNASGNKINFDYVNNADLADIDCLWTNDSSKVSSISEGGQAQVQYNPNGIKHVKVVILTLDPTPDSPLSQNQVQAVCLHEIGHALGLIGHSPKPNDIMFCSLPTADAKTALSPRDIDTIRRLYTSDVQIALKPCVKTTTEIADKNAVNNEGVELMSSRAYAQAIEKFETALKLDPDYEPARENLSNAYNTYALDLIKTGKEQEAESLLQKAMKLPLTLRGAAIKLKVTTMHNYANVLRKRHRDSEADKIEAEAKALLEKKAAR